MIKVSIDEAHALDMLSILEIKKQDTTKIWNEIASQIGIQKLNRIHKSQVYQELKDANEIIFRKLNEIKKLDSFVSAQIIDELNYSRFLAKKALQNRFFKVSCSEVKIGYEEMGVNQR